MFKLQVVEEFLEYACLDMLTCACLQILVFVSYEVSLSHYYISFVTCLDMLISMPAVHARILVFYSL
jgi:hypothetical protein